MAGQQGTISHKAIAAASLILAVLMMCGGCSCVEGQALDSRLAKCLSNCGDQRHSPTRSGGFACAATCVNESSKRANECRNQCMNEETTCTSKCYRSFGQEDAGFIPCRFDCYTALQMCTNGCSAF